MAASCPFAHLPSEIYAAILDQLPLPIAKGVVLSLTRALPHAPIPQNLLFHNVHIVHPVQSIQLTRRLRQAPNYRACIRSFALESLEVDADVIVNLVRWLPRLTSLSLCVGPTFAPEHLEELLRRPIPGLQLLALRFVP